MFAFPSPKFDEDEYFRTFGTLIENASPSVVVVYPELEAKVAATLDGGERSIQLCTPQRLVETSGYAPAIRESGAIAFLQYSSGTTGVKKGVAITHRAALAQIDRYAAAIQLDERDLIATWLPLYHDMGLVACCLLPFVTGVPVLAMAPHRWVRSPMLLLHLIGQHRATLCWLPNFAYNFLARNIMARELEWLDLSSLRAVVNCSEPVMASSHEAFVERFESRGFARRALATSYAMAETTFAVTSGGITTALVEDVVDRDALAQGHAAPVPATDPRAVRLVSSGRPIADTRVRIVSAQGRPLADRAVGEIVVESPSLFSGYFGHANGAADPIGGQFRTGDLGYLADGELYVTGRLKDLVIVAGRNLAPHDIEAAVSDIPGVVAGRAVAFGLSDEREGTERLVIVAETELTDPAHREALQREIVARVSAQTDVAPGDVRLVAPRWLRKSTSGKIARDRNRQRYLAELATLSATDVQASDARRGIVENTLDRALRCVRTVLAGAGRPGAQSIGPDDRLVTTGLVDSLLLVSLIVEAEQAFGITVPPTHLDIGHFDSARRLAALACELGTGTPEALQNVNAVWAMDDRDKACERFLQHAQDVDLLVLGSSKAMHLAASVAREFGYTAFNFWLQNARAEDWLAALRFALHHGAPLSTLILLMDVEGLSNAAAVDVRLTESRHLAPYIREVELEARAAPAPAAASDRFNTIFVQYKLGQHEPWAWALSGVNYAVTDRVHEPGAAPLDRSPRALADPHDSDAAYALRMRDFTRLDPRRLEDLRELLQICARRGIHVHCCISPVHAELDAFLAAHTSYHARLDDLAAVLAAWRQPGLTFHDTRVPSLYGGARDDFNDAAHIGYASSDALMRFILDGARAATGAQAAIGSADYRTTAKEPRP
jgi:acyl-CoA synthetase (AMP-forming)/AMP-acid ligase II/acyl carrier protein